MPFGEKKWDQSAERDLCVAIIVGNSTEDKVRHNWPSIHKFMNQLGYNFTKDAIAQHFTKVIMRDFKDRHGGKVSSALSGAAQAALKKPTTRKRAVAKRVKSESEDDDDSDVVPLAKKSKVKTEPRVKSETGGRDERARSATIFDDESWRNWINDLTGPDEKKD